MAKVKLNDIPREIRQEIIGEFFSVISELKTKKEVLEFFVGTLTPSEALMLARRMQVAKRIIMGKSYEKIVEDLSVGKTTITNVSNWLDGRDENYKKILKKYLFKNKTKVSKTEIEQKYIPKYKTGLSRYPGHDLAMKVLGIDYLNKKIFGE